MDNSVKKLTEMLKPLIVDLDDQKTNLNDKKQELENVSRLLAYTNDNLDMVSVYADQDLIINNLDKINSDKDEYKASCYLLKSENENVKNLPQYEKACNFIQSIIDYFKECKSRLVTETQDLEKLCREKELDKKYYDAFSDSNPYIEDIKEFEEFMQKHEMDEDDKINILIYAIKNNALRYERKNS